MKLQKSIKTLAMFGLFASAVAAEDLIQVTTVSKESTPESRSEPYTNGDRVEAINILRPPLVATEDVAEISATEDPLVARVKLSDDGAKKFSAKTTGFEGKRIAIIIQGKIVSAPWVNNAPLGRSFEVSGFKDAEEAKAFVEAFKKQRG